jgi:hypothetical protein
VSGPPNNQQALSGQTTVVVEREPAPRRRATYHGDQRNIVDGDEQQWLGPDRRGIMWRPCHADYNDQADRTVVIFAPVSPTEIDLVPGLRQKLELIQAQQATSTGAVSHIGGMQ